MFEIEYINLFKRSDLKKTQQLGPKHTRRYERIVNVFSRAGFSTELVRADLISEKISGVDVTRGAIQTLLLS